MSLYDNDPMKMIGHDDVLIHGNFFTDNLRPQQFIPNYLSDSAGDDFTIDNLPKQRLPPIGTDGDKISKRIDRRCLRPVVDIDLPLLVRARRRRAP